MPGVVLLLPEVTLLAAYRVITNMLFKYIQLMCNLGSSCHTGYVSPQLCVPFVYQRNCVKPSLQPLLTYTHTHILHLALLISRIWLK